MESLGHGAAVDIHSRVEETTLAEVVRLVADTDVELVPERSIGVRALDIVVSASLLLLVLPVLLGIAISIKLTGPGPIIFRQPRTGRNGREFSIVKFRTMVPDAVDRLDELLDDDLDLREDFTTSAKLKLDPRVSPVGRVLRPSGLDELPQLWNVLRGDMSMVGPRPLSLGEERRYGHYAPLVWTVKPGITGPWQIGGRNDIPYAERVAIDVNYVRSRSVGGDLTILGRTVRQFLTGRLRGGY